jgi:hypothetical protein
MKSIEDITRQSRLAPGDRWMVYMVLVFIFFTFVVLGLLAALLVLFASAAGPPLAAD